MATYQHGLTTDEHNNIAVDDYYARVFDRVKQHKRGTIVDAFSGGPRDILKMMDVLDGNGDFVAIDADPARIIDLITENFDRAGRIVEGLIIPEFQLVDGRNEIERAERLQQAFRHQKVAVFEHKFASNKNLPYNLQADFMLCNAGIMFVEPSDLAFALTEMADTLRDGGELVLRFSGARDDKEADLGKSYFIHDPDHIQEILEEHGLTTQRFDDLPDPVGRGFDWVDISVLNTFE